MELRGWIRGGTQQLGKVKIPDSEWGSSRRGSNSTEASEQVLSLRNPQTGILPGASKGLSQRGTQRGAISPGTPLFMRGRVRLPQLNPKQGTPMVHTSPAGTQHQLPTLRPQPSLSLLDPGLVHARGAAGGEAPGDCFGGRLGAAF